ncbi:uncharacterized protein MKZ38_004313 [Zalerion maritima]|uniref:phosphoserine phosphatase n=1 Tax=Zalerion maritima TaxID=339359 RepID=A0AAD5RME2_9PEZI|nr:uncharacterized protein MKZ38_004313 [Zalerion maritima]
MTTEASTGGSPSKTGATRPQLSSSTRTSSFLAEHQQYRPPKSHPEGHFGIDTVVEDLPTKSTPSPRNVAPFNGVPSPSHPPKVIDSGISHSFSHPNCASPGKTATDRLVATLFYKAKHPRTSNALPSPKLPAADSGDFPPNMAPTDSIDAFPLEPPTADPEPLDHLYGSYISPLCITSFLHLMSTFPLPAGETDISSSHRCLDNSEHPLVVELTLSPCPSPSYLSLQDLRKHELIYRFEREWNVDVALQSDTLWRRHPRLVIFDMDSTLITQEVIDLMAATITSPPDLASRIADITHRAMLGELEFEGAFRERVKLLTGLSEDIFTDLRPILDVTKGVPELIKALKRLGVKTAVLSGGFQPLTSWLAGELDIDHAHANNVVIQDGKLTGEVEGLIVGKQRKRDLLLEIAEKEGVDLRQVIAIGDGANDLMMMAAAALGVAWNAKPRVQMDASARLNGETLLDLLYLFGLTSEEIAMLVE